jgi:hypothetical protein
MNIKILFFLIFIFLGAAMANRLENETSPYLLQHKDNPVNWYPWGEEAFKKAEEEQKPVFLSIGYSTCHWCHVMAHESFEDEEVAKILNKDYICIKVDREQFPHIDGFYQKVYRVMNKKGGGWPLTIVMTPDKKPFFAATYIPKYEGYGSRGLMDILKQINSIDMDDLKEQGSKVLTAVKNNEYSSLQKENLDKKLLSNIVKQFKSYYDFRYKGFADRPKFPQFANIILLLKIYKINLDKEALSMAVDSLRAMANGGIFDQIEGAFYRYSVDERWMIPHFEKMLYTNAEALEAYSLAYTITKDPLFKEVIDKTIAQIDKRFMQNGVYKSASNADSRNFDGENEEGFYFVYEHLKALEYLTQNGIDHEDAKESLQYLGIVLDGNFDGDNSNPHITGNREPKVLQRVIKLLEKMREHKEYPFIDNKINTAWNALYLKGKLAASKIDETYLNETLSSLDALIKLMYKEGVLYHQTIIGKQPFQKAILEDYSFLISTLFEAYEITLDKKYFTLYEKLVKDSIKLFFKDDRWHESNDGFETYADIEDSGYASALGVHFSNLILYSVMEGEYAIFEMVKRSMEKFGGYINKYPSHFPNAAFAPVYYDIEPVFIKSDKENLKLFEAEDFNYPFVFKKEYDSKEFLACKLNSCFSYSSKLEKIIEDINSLR